MDYNKVAKEVISHVGGPKNIKKAFHCATRLRLMLKDPSLADEKALESVDGVKGTFLVQEQFQIIFGSGTVNLVTDEVLKEFVKPFDLAKAPLFRASLVTLKDGVLLLFDMHHIISDGLLTNFLWNKLFKKSVFCSFAFPVNKIYEDVYIMPKLLEQAKKICYTNLILYYYYQREDSYVNYYSKEKNDNYLEVCHEVYRQLLKYEILNDKLKAYRIFYIYSAL